jgi:hypothetical protein
MSTDPSLQERYAKAWAKLDKADRRRILRASNRMQALEDPAEAALAVEFANRQRRLWRRWWWVLPVVGGLAALPGGWEMAVFNAIFGGVLVGFLAAAFTWRSGRSAKINQEVVDAASRNRRSGSPKKRSKAGGGSAGNRKRRRGGRR